MRISTARLATLVAAANFLIIDATLLGQTAILSDPAGLRTISCLSNSDTFVAVPFMRSPEFVGLVESVLANVITVRNTPGWSANKFVYVSGTQPNRYYVLIGKATGANPKEGRTYAITSNGTNTVTLNTQDVLTDIPPGAQITIIPHWTLATLFPIGNQNITFTPSTSTLLYKTQILVPDHTTQGINLPVGSTYFFSNNINHTESNIGWRVVGDRFTDHGDDPLLPDGYFVVRNLNSAPTRTFTALGSFPSKKLTIPLATGASGQQDNPVGIIRPFNVALSATGLGPADGSFVTNDQLLLFDNATSGLNKSPSAIYYYDTSITSGGWRLTGAASSDHGNDVIPAGTGFVIRKAATASGQTAFWTNSPVSPLTATSRKTHGTSGDFDVNLPLGGLGVEDRGGQGVNFDEHSIRITFAAPVTLGNATVTSGTGSVSHTSGSGTTVLTIGLAGVLNAQILRVTLVGVSDGVSNNDIDVRIGFLAGDANGDGVVNSADISYVQSKSGATVNGTNFRADLNADGSMNSADISFVQSKSGTALP